MCCEEAFLRHPAAAQAVLQASACRLSSENQALAEPGHSHQLHLQRAVSRLTSLPLTYFLYEVCAGHSFMSFYEVRHLEHIFA